MFKRRKKKLLPLHAEIQQIKETILSTPWHQIFVKHLEAYSPETQ